MECHYKCGELIPCRQLTEHEQDECQRTATNGREDDMESLMRKVEQRHIVEIATVRWGRVWREILAMV